MDDPFARPHDRHNARSAAASSLPAAAPSVTRVSYHSEFAMTSRPAAMSALNSAGVVSLPAFRECDGLLGLLAAPAEYRMTNLAPVRTASLRDGRADE